MRYYTINDFRWSEYKDWSTHGTSEASVDLLLYSQYIQYILWKLFVEFFISRFDIIQGGGGEFISKL
jgi:hypothetical protein